MQIARWGNSLAVRLPADLVRTLGLREGDRIELEPSGEGRLALSRHPRADEVLSGLRRFRGRLASEDRLSRDAANGR
ncbi:AbrB/MazE/SpoVT family DNA-binding domain-containing protein [Rhodovulum sulfidophilum]|uniref:AbrB/MazE/SpoVT family DNA-binding domain-containing protein n=2 Tax=Rhodovulum sulfidophilum TaxID=35806 RepID=A0ABS1RWZ6_RHOSU|nr:AbrB/MazE/SpoVT family DNA-binding domain-containing protein [Rhodovulum sulfidophilum]MBL3610604.1 AbrB/MazE/SpoVT family DNA-binding domain-containing protein [Rhodovulum sulfidophilum]